MEFEKIRDIIADVINVSEDKITPATGLSADLGADSLDVLQIISEIEDQFGVEFTGDDAERIKTVGDVVNFVKKMAK